MTTLTPANRTALLRKLEGDARLLSVELWTLTVEDPDTATVQSEAAAIHAPPVEEISRLVEIMQGVADRIELLIYWDSQ